MTAFAVEAPPDVRALWRRVRLPAVVVLVLVVAAIVLAAVENSPPRQPLDPRDPSASGGRALAQLVRDRGVTLDQVASPAGIALDSGTTVFVPDPGSLLRDQLTALVQSTADVVVVGARPRELRALRVGDTSWTGYDGFPATTSPQCAVDETMVAGPIQFAGSSYLASPPVTGCYPVDGAAGLVVAARGSARTVVLGSPVTFSNDRLDEQGDAALALSLLTRRPHLVWVLPQPPTHAPADTPHRGLVDLLPPRVLWGALELVIAVVVLALWRARRLGPVVAEPLPVVVRATETVEGRARLLRAARARGSAAQALREASTARLRVLLGLGVDAPRPAVVDAVARHAGSPGASVEHLLYGAVPQDDAALLRLANDLDTLERSVRRP
jgi:hypothetical protein